jgi:uncharacterized membrane protein
METKSSAAYRLGHQAFVVGLVLKGLNAVAELIIGTALLLVPFSLMQSWATSAAGWAETLVPGWSPRLDRLLESMAPSGVLFIAWYFLSHGVLKAFVIGCLAARRLWAYPLGIVVFVGFGVYQTWEWAHGGSSFYLALDVLDAALIALTALEWVHARSTKVEADNNQV